MQLWVPEGFHSYLIIGLPVAQSKNESRLCRKKTKWRGRILLEGVACPFPLAVGPTSEGRGSLRFYHEFSIPPRRESRNECFFSIVYTLFRRSYKLSVQNVRPLQPNTRVVYASCSREAATARLPWAPETFHARFPVSVKYLW